MRHLESQAYQTHVLLEFNPLVSQAALTYHHPLEHVRLAARRLLVPREAHDGPLGAAHVLAPLVLPIHHAAWQEGGVLRQLLPWQSHWFSPQEQDS
jgi:hypothetical protein